MRISFRLSHYVSFFFFNDTATTEIYTLSLHDALPIYAARQVDFDSLPCPVRVPWFKGDRKSTRLNSSHYNISYAVFCLKKNKKTIKDVLTIRQKTPATTIIHLYHAL